MIVAVALVELVLDARHIAQFGRAHRSEVLRVREENAQLLPIQSWNLICLQSSRGEMGGFVANAYAIGFPPWFLRTGKAGKL